MIYSIFFYKTSSGASPVEDFIESLDIKMQAKLFKTMKCLKENGPNLREPYSKHLEDGIFELRAQVGNDITRVLYFFYIGKTIIFTNGFIKKTQKTPRSEITLAKKYRNDYFVRNEGK